MSAAPATASGRWIHGPASDLLLGCGLWYALALVVLSFVGAGFREGAGPTVMAFAVLIFSTPHYGATLLRVYAHREDRRTYALFAVWITLALFGLFAVGVHSALVGSMLVTLYLTWSPWHYTGQNYGLAVMFLRRRGAQLSPLTRRLFYASFVLSYLLTFLAIHSGERPDNYAPLSAGATSGEGFRFLTLGLPAAISEPLFAVATLGYLGTLLASAALLLRHARPRDLLPTFALVLSQALWFSAPLLLHHGGISARIDPWVADGPYYFLWIAVAHALQYLWVTSHYAGASGSRGTARYFVQATLAGSLIWTIPALLFVPGLLGRLSYGAGLAILVASLVNLHHFILDGAIWKLRDGRVAKILLRDRPSAEPSAKVPQAPTGASARPIWVIAGLCAVIMFVGRWESTIGMRGAKQRGDLPGLHRAIDHLAWIGREGPNERLELARAYARRHEDARAIEQFERAIEIHPSVQTWFALGSFHAARSRYQPAANAFESAVELDPSHALAHYELGLASLKLGRKERARDAFARAAEIAPERPIHRTLLEKTERELREERATVQEKPDPA